MGPSVGADQHSAGRRCDPVGPWHAGHQQPDPETPAAHLVAPEPPPGAEGTELRQPAWRPGPARAGIAPDARFRLPDPLPGHRHHHRLPRSAVGGDSRGLRAGRHRRGRLAEFPWRHAGVERVWHEGPRTAHRPADRDQPGGTGAGTGAVADQSHPAHAELQQPARLHHAGSQQTRADCPGATL
ncbi:hypothetical protein D9M68_803690 [compost metagenome]